ncbi:MAG: hypothetical protein HQL68_06825 [Magnetococcales bacterium]|nr:hypothetical protein [Magnetococcales bacterium]
MVAASGMELIKGSSLKENPDTPGFTRILTKQQQEESGEGDQFVRFMPDGSLSIFKKEKVVEVPQIDVEEINKRRLEQLEREVYQKAFEEGEKTGIEIGQEKMEQEIHRLIPQLEGVLRELDNLPHRVLMASENFLVESLLSFNRELLAHELTINPEGIADRVRRILEHSVGRKGIVIRVSPANAKILERIEQFEKLEIVGDLSVASGSVVMESDFGGMEDNLEARLREVETALRQQLQERLDQSGISDIADAARLKAENEKNAELTPLVEDQVEGEAVEQAADEKDGLEDDNEPPLDESLADEDSTLDDFLDSVAQPDSLDDQLESKTDDVFDDLLDSSGEAQSQDETDNGFDDLLDSSSEAQSQDETDNGFDDLLDSSSEAQSQDETDNGFDDLLDSSSDSQSHEETDSGFDDLLDSSSDSQSQDDTDNDFDDLLDSGSDSQSHEETDSGFDDLLDSSSDSHSDEALADAAGNGSLDSDTEIIEQEPDIIDSSELTPPPHDDDEWSALAEDGEDSDASDTFLEKEEPSTPNDEDQTE